MSLEIIETLKEKNSLILLSTPYGHENPLIKAKRKYNSALTMIRAFKQDLNVFSPIVYGLASMEYSNLNILDDYKTWAKFCDSAVAACECLFVVNMEGWDKSSGVKGEIATAKLCNKKVYLINFSEHVDDPILIIEEL